MNSNSYDSVNESSDDEDIDKFHTDTRKLINAEPKNAGSEKEGIDITFKPSDDEDPVYEECSNINK